MFGIENIEFESTTAIHITYAEPIQATLHIQLDTTSGKILDTSSVSCVFFYKLNIFKYIYMYTYIKMVI